MSKVDLVAWVRSIKKGDKVTEPPLVSLNKLADELEKTRAERDAAIAECAAKHTEAKPAKARPAADEDEK